MRRIKIVILVAVVLGAVALSAGCDSAQLRPYGVAGYEAYTGWIARSPYWTVDVPRMTPEQQTAFAEASWMEHERAIEWAQDQLGKGQ